MIEKIKAAAFPVLLTVVTFFLIAFYNEFKSQGEVTEKIKIELQSQSGRFQLIEYRLQQIEKSQNQQLYKHQINGE